MSNRPACAWNAAIALFVTAAIVVQLWIAVRVSATPPGHRSAPLPERPRRTASVRVFELFTIQSNVLSGLTSAQLARNPEPRRSLSGGPCVWLRCSGSRSPALSTRRFSAHEGARTPRMAGDQHQHDVPLRRADHDGPRLAAVWSPAVASAPGQSNWPCCGRSRGCSTS